MARNNRLWILLAFLVGLLLGWVVLGWWLFPVQYTNAYLQDLRTADKAQVLALAAQNYQLTGDLTAASQLVRQLGSKEEVSELASDAIQAAQAAGNQAAADQVRNLSMALGLALSPEAAPPTTAPAPTTPAPAQESGGLDLLTICGSALGILLLAGGIGLAIWLLNRRRAQRPPAAGAPQPAEFTFQEPASSADWAESAPATISVPAASFGGAARLAQQFTAVYNLGDASFDESFDVETAEAGYLGECGMSVSEFVHGDPNRVTALEVWLFDKSDIRTVTKVLMSDYAFGSQSLRDKLASHGEALLARPGLSFVLDAQTLRLEGQVTDVQYVEGDTPPHSSLRRLAVTLRVARSASGEAA